MVVINKGQANTVILTLTEKVTEAIPYFLFRFVCDLTKVEYTFLMTDTSIYTERYNKFVLTEGTTVDLIDTGFYHYYVYEQDNNTNTNYTLAGNLLEVGKVWVSDGTQSIETVSNDYTETFITNG